REELGRLRRAELLEAARALGVAEVRHGGHADGALAAADQELLVGEMVALLRDVRPEVVVTFGPEGAPTGHRDHQAISRAATAAFFLADLPTEYAEQLVEVKPHRAARLYYCAWEPPGANGDLRLLSVPFTTRVDVSAYRETKRQAFYAHASQRQHEARFE